MMMMMTMKMVWKEHLENSIETILPALQRLPPWRRKGWNLSHFFFRNVCKMQVDLFRLASWWFSKSQNTGSKINNQGSWQRRRNRAWRRDFSSLTSKYLASNLSLNHFGDIETQLSIGNMADYVRGRRVELPGDNLVNIHWWWWCPWWWWWWWWLL